MNMNINKCYFIHKLSILLIFFSFNENSKRNNQNNQTVRYKRHWQKGMLLIQG
jgi:hypothetical protein